MTEQQIKWAASHDWFVCDKGDGSIIVRDAYTLRGEYHSAEIVWTGSFSELRDWAGY